VVVGAGIGGLSAALALAGDGMDVTVLERAAAPGGKMRQVPVGGALIDGGPTVFTMRWVFEELFAKAGLDFAAEVPAKAASLLARHSWGVSENLDLFVDIDRSADAVGRFSGAKEARRYRAFVDEARTIYRTLEAPFLRSTKPNPVSLVDRVGWMRMGDLWRLRPFETMWQALVRQFGDPRLRQLYGRYATYCGSSPFQAPATLQLVAHVEQDGVWYVEGGMYGLASGLARAATRLGARLRTDADVTRIETDRIGVSAVHLRTGERIPADRVIFNGDASAIGSGLLGTDVAGAVTATPPQARSLSAMVWTATARADGFPLTRHNVFFSRDYQDEFARLFGRRTLPDEPTVYVCAQDRGDDAPETPPDSERLLILVNAPATGDSHHFDDREIEACHSRMLAVLTRCGLSLTTRDQVLTTPNGFNALFPATGGALYGRASHGWLATFQRPDGRTNVPGLYLAGGSVHPGPGVPMAALSGRLAAQALMSDCVSTSASRRAATSGGMSTPSRPTAASV
jgi:1-hydroxycarotenoid 3,4-desaturase